jgi:hypothetical protein
MPESANEHLDYLKAWIAKNAPAHVLDVGMGRGNYGWFLRNACQWAGKLTGMEIWAPYVVGPDALAGGNRTYYDGGIVVMDMREASTVMADMKPDVIFAFDVIEHVTRDEGIAVIRAMQRAAKIAVLVCPPIVPYPQGEWGGNPHEAHRHDWTVEDMTSLGSTLRHRGPATGLFEFPGGRVDKRITVMLNTARDDSAFKGKSILKTITDDLAKQTFPQHEFEFVAVDGVYADRPETFAEHAYPFRILHVPPKETAMTREKRPAICAYKNTAIAHARGELLLTIDDGCILDPGYLQRCWTAWTERRCLAALCHAVFDNGNPLPGWERNDSRYVFLDGAGKCLGPIGGNPQAPHGQGFMAFPLDAALALNGYDEMFDGARGLEDMDFGARLQRSGQHILLDTNHRVGLYAMGPWTAKHFEQSSTQGVIKCSQTTYRVRGTKEVRANSRPWTPEEWALVTPRCTHLAPDASHCTLFGPKNPCPYVGVCSDQEHPGLQVQRDNPPVFDLRILRAANGIT